MSKSLATNFICRMIILGTWLVVPILAFGESAAPPQAENRGLPKETTEMDEPVALDWEASKDSSGQKLLIRYTLQNRSQERVYVLDQLVAFYGAGLRILPKAVIVNNSDQPETVKFVRGYTHPTQPVFFILAPAARALEPGARLQGSAEAPLPLVAWQPIGRPRPLKTPIYKMVLEIGYVTGTPEFAGPIASDGTKLASPSLGYLEQHQRFVRTAPRPLP